MPIKHAIDHTRRRVTATAMGEVTDADIFGYQNEVWKRADVAGYDEIVDMTRAVRIVEPNAARMQELAALSATMDPNAGSARMAIVAPEEVAYQLGRVYESMRRSAPGARKVMTFRTMAEAENWLAWKGRDRATSQAEKE